MYNYSKNMTIGTKKISKYHHIAHTILQYQSENQKTGELLVEDM